eukprot:Partr_v1_DN25964_c1_g1_i5_m68562 putative protein kinase kinase kinase
MPEDNSKIMLILLVVEGALLVIGFGLCIWKYKKDKTNRGHDTNAATSASESGRNLPAAKPTIEENPEGAHISPTIDIDPSSWRSRERNDSSITKTSKIGGTRTSAKKYTIGAGTETTTMAGSDIELSIPGYLEVTFGQDFNVSRLLTKGGSASVYLGKTDHIRLRKFGKVVVIKKIEQNPRVPEIIAKDAFYQELAMMWYFRDNPRFIKVLGYCDKPLSFVSKFYTDGSLDRLLSKKKIPIVKGLVLNFAIEISLAIADMHAAGFIHCDLKSANILIDRDHKNNVFPVLSDFGISQIIDPTAVTVKAFPIIYNNAFSFNYAAPDVFLRIKNKQRVDDVAVNKLKMTD